MICMETSGKKEKHESRKKKHWTSQFINTILKIVIKVGLGWH